MTTRRLAFLASIAIVVFAACSRSEEPGAGSGTVVAEPTAAGPSAPTPEAARATTPDGSSGSGTQQSFDPPGNPDAARAFEDLRHLAVEIGSRSAGTPQELAAAEYIAEQLTAAGYEATIEPFEVDVPLDNSTITLPDGAALPGFALDGGADGTVEAPLVSGGLGYPEDLAELPTQGAVLLLERGVLTFGEKAQNAEAAGAVALIIANHQPGPFRGTLGELTVDIPVLAISSEDAAALDPIAAAGGSVEVAVVRSSEPFTSHNVVGRTPGTECSMYLGAHYDSVPAGPGANDNASGTATMLEVARTHRTPGLCPIAFGAEEIGLFGSRAFVDTYDLTGARFLLNFDMTAKLTEPQIITSGDAPSLSLGRDVSEVTATLGEALPLGSFGRFSGSDHIPFAEAGVPAVTFYSGSDSNIHTAQDNIDNVRVEDLDVMLQAGVAALRSLLETG